MRVNALSLGVMWVIGVSSAGAAPLTYQGELMDAGRPADGRYDLQLTVHSDPVQRSALAFPVTIENVEVRDGRFRVDADFGPLLRGGVPVSPESAWLEVAVRDAGGAGAFDSLDKREKIALDKAIAACWSSTGDDGSNPAINFLGTLDAQPLELRVNNQRAARFEPNTISPNLLQGHATNLVASGVRGAVVSGGGAVSVSDPDVNGESSNRVDGHYAVVGGGAANQAGDIGLPAASAFATVGGGRGNQATGEASTVSGGAQNDARARAATVSGGSSNDARAPGATVGGGFTNVTHATASVIAGGDQNQIELAAPGATGASGAAIGGGDRNTITATGENATIGGGADNIADGAGATVAGGRSNTAVGTSSTVGGGGGNSAIGVFATVPGGDDNCAGASGSFAAGSGAIARPGGTQCGAGFAAGGSGDVGSFVWADRSTSAAFASSGPNQFVLRAAGGVGVNRSPDGDGVLVLSPVGIGSAELHLRPRPDLESHRIRSSGARLQVQFRQPPAADQTLLEFQTVLPGPSTQHRLGLLGAEATTTAAIRVGIAGTGTNGNGASLSLGGTWTNASSRAFKRAFESIDAGRILDGVLALPLSRWEYRDAAVEGRHLGPMAEDFFAAFGLGDDSRYISTTDAAGVAFAAIQGLSSRVDERLSRAEDHARQREDELSTLRGENATLKERIERLSARLDALERERGG